MDFINCRKNNIDCNTYFNNLFNSLHEGFLLCEAVRGTAEKIEDFTVIECNNACTEIFGIRKQHIKGSKISKIVPNIVPEWLEACKQTARNGISLQKDLYFRMINKHLRINITRPAKSQLAILFNDITEIVKADEELKIHSILFHYAKDIILYLKSDGSIIAANNTATDSYGYTHEELMSMKLQQLRHPDTLGEYDEQMSVSALSGLVFETVHVRKNGTPFPVEVSSRTVDINGELTRIHIIRDITERKEADKRIQHLANYDALTGIPNSRYLRLQYEKLLEQAKRGNFKFAVMLFDIDKFKSINDTYGHAGGDVALTHVTNKLQEAVRESDIIGRLGGDEFLVVQPFIKTKEEAATLAERILRYINTPLRLGNTSLTLSVSIGISIFPDDSMLSNELIQYADQAMYHVKGTGSNSYSFYKG